MNNTTFNIGTVVALDDELLGLPASDGDLVPAHKLGPGLVEQLHGDKVYVHWVNAGLQVWLPPEDVRPVGEGAHLITLKRCDRSGACTFWRHKVAQRLGFQHNWTAELHPRSMVRVLRDDGWAWRFSVNSVLNEIKVEWPLPPEDDDAEALTVAELAISR